jgi:hypothetical protein
MSVVGLSQSVDEMRKRYGAPTSYSEVYLARPYNESTKLSVVATVTYSKDKTEISGLRVEIFPYFVGINVASTNEERELKTRMIDEVLKEILPMERRGKLIIAGSVSGSTVNDLFGTFERYEKVRIFYNGTEHRYAEVVFEKAKPECLRSRKNCF